MIEIKKYFGFFGVSFNQLLQKLEIFIYLRFKGIFDCNHTPGENGTSHSRAGSDSKCI